MEAQKSYRIGCLDLDRASPESSGYRDVVRQALVGYVNVQNVAVENRCAEGKEDELAALAGQLVNLRVDVILAIGAQATVAAKQATKSIPNVMIASDGAFARVGKSPAERDANITGVAYPTTELRKQWLQLVKELVPRAQRVAVLHNSAHPAGVAQWKDTQLAAQALAAEVRAFEAQDARGFASTLAALTEHRADALIVPGDPMGLFHRRQIVELATKHTLPVIYGYREFADAGGLVSYGPNLVAMYRRAGGMVGKILNGAKPRELAVEQPSRFELVLNLKAAKAIGLTVPESLMQRADRVITP